jgi:hypothetical protein
MTLKINDNGTNREMTTEEETAHKAWQKIAQDEAQAQAQIVADRQALKEATLAKLGLTADEVAALLS